VIEAATKMRKVSLNRDLERMNKKVLGAYENISSPYQYSYSRS
jgi:hypothetical protein